MSLPDKLRGKTWHTYKGEIDSAFLERVLEAVASGRERYRAFDATDEVVHGNTDRRIDKATQLLRRAGLIEFAGGKWRVVVERVMQ
jgi:hypothetical protein